jgi:hypothetical protein
VDCHVGTKRSGPPPVGWGGVTRVSEGGKITASREVCRAGSDSQIRSLVAWVVLRGHRGPSRPMSPTPLMGPCRKPVW